MAHGSQAASKKRATKASKSRTGCDRIDRGKSFPAWCLRGDQVQWWSKVIAEPHDRSLQPTLYRLLAVVPSWMLRTCTATLPEKVLPTGAELSRWKCRSQLDFRGL